MSDDGIHAPELPQGLQWFNTERPLTLASQRGKVVLLDFWTYCCINCMHVLPDLRYLETKYGDRLTVIGVHSPKFPHERIGVQLQKAINRFHIRHPVANDPKFQLWRTYGIKAWPSMIVIDTRGYVLGVLRGEGHRQQLDRLIQEQIELAEKRGDLRPSKPAPKLQPEPPATLSFPGKVYATENLLYVSDSGRNRVLETYHDGRVRRVFGSGSAGFLDGNGAQAAFNNPQGMVRVNDFLYLADTGNHAIRRIHLKTADVDTMAGNGEQGRYEGTFYHKPQEAPLNSPWDLAFAGGALYIAMAGQHQIWRLQLAQQTLGLYAGSGREALTDGSLLRADFAQPSGLAMGSGQLYVADAETSAVRAIQLEQEKVRTLVGQGLFEFGDLDGDRDSARLQHPLGVWLAKDRNELWLADTYNGKIKKLDLKSNIVSSIDVRYALDEPGGISGHGDRLFVANTNAHEVLRIDLATGQATPLEIHEDTAEFL